MKKVFASVIIFILICCVAAQAEEDDYICVKPGDSGYDVRIVLEAAYYLGFLEELDDEMDKYIEEYIPAVQQLEETFSLDADGIIHLSEIELIDGMICPGMEGEAVKNTLVKLANLGYLLDLPENQSFYDSEYIERVKEAEETLGLTSDGCLTSSEQKVIDDLEWIIPEPLTKLDITYDEGAAVLKWSASKKATEYRIERDGQFVAAVKETTWTDRNIKRGNQYVYTVQPFRYGINSPGKTKEFIAELILPTDGSTVIFGQYEQDNNTANGPEPIEWIVLDVQDGKALLLSKYGLDAKPYNTEEKSITWEETTIRQWLNNDFLNAAFSTEEQNALLNTWVDNSSAQGHSTWRTSGGNNTQDRIFLLSFAEANKYLNVTTTLNSINLKSRVAPTAYAKSKGAFVSSVYKTEDGSDAGWWWLRSPGSHQNNIAHIDANGSIDRHFVDPASACVRPAMWLDMKSGEALMTAVEKKQESVVDRCFRSLVRFFWESTSVKLLQYYQATDDGSQNNVYLMDISFQNENKKTVENTYFVVFDSKREKVSAIEFKGIKTRFSQKSDVKYIYTAVLSLEDGEGDFFVNQLNYTYMEMGKILRRVYNELYQ